MLHELLAFSRVVARASSIRCALLAVLPVAAMAQSAWITRVVAPDDGAYDRSISLSFTVNFNEPVFVQGAPRLALQIGDTTRYATLAPALSEHLTGRTALTFQYEPGAADADSDGIAVGNLIELNGGAIVAADATPAQLSFASPDTRGVNVALLRPPTPRILAARTGGATGENLVLSGTADGGSVVFITRAGIGLIGATIAAPNGAWSLEYPDARVGMLQFSAAAENSDGILSAESALFNVTIVHTAGNEVPSTSGAL